MAECLQSKLARVGQPLWKSLSLSFDDQVVLAVAEGASQVAAKGDLGACKVILSGVVNINTGDIKSPGRCKLIYLGSNP